MLDFEIIKRKPDHVGENGVKWWLDKDMTKYAKDKGVTDVSAWIVEEKSGKRTRLLTKKNEIIFERPGLEDFATHIDMMSLSQNSVPENRPVFERVDTFGRKNARKSKKNR